MAVHNLQAENLVSSKWETMDKYPKDGRIFIVEFDNGETIKAQWNAQRNSLMIERLPENTDAKMRRWRTDD